MNTRSLSGRPALLLLASSLFSTAALAQEPAELVPRPVTCANTVRDANGTACIEAANDATLGQLFPLSVDFYLDPLTRFVGMGTTAPLFPLDLCEQRSGANLVTAFIENSGESGTGLWILSNDSTVGTSNFGLRAVASASNGAGVAGFNRTGSFVTACGVSGTTFGGGAGVSGAGLDPADDNDGVFGSTQSDTLGSGVCGVNFSTVGTGAGVEGLTFSTTDGANGIYGEVISTSPGSFSSGVYGVSKGTGGFGIGVRGEQRGTGFGVYGKTDGAGFGVIGEAPAPGFAVFGSGDTGATGTKSFVQPHPTDAAKEIRFVSLEGNEAGTYFRGTARIAHGRAHIEVPEAFRLVSEPSSLTVQVTGMGRGQLWIEKKGLDEIVVAGERDIEFDYFVNGIRHGYADFEPICPNTTLVPRLRDVPYEGVPPHARELMVQNGTLNPDHTPNELTAHRMGWTLVDRPAPVPDLDPPAVIQLDDMDELGRRLPR